jgi:hypothetical protein
MIRRSSIGSSRNESVCGVCARGQCKFSRSIYGTKDSEAIQGRTSAEIIPRTTHRFLVVLALFVELWEAARWFQFRLGVYGGLKGVNALKEGHRRENPAGPRSLTAARTHVERDRTTLGLCVC